MSLPESRSFARGDILPSYWTNSIQEFVGPIAANFRVRALSATTVEVPAGSGQGAAIIGIAGRWRWAEATVSRAMPGGAAGTFSVFAVAADNSVSSTPQPNTDNTNYVFDLRITTGANPAAEPGVADIFRLVATVDWDGTKITAVHPVVANADNTIPIAPTADVPAQTPLRVVGASGATAPLATFQAVAGGPVLASVAASGALAAPSLAAGSITLTGTVTGMTNVTGSGNIVLAASPTLTGTPLTPTGTIDVSSTQVASQAFVLNQASSSAPLMNGAAAVGTSTRYARADHVHATDTSRAPLASPSFSGTPTAPTPTTGDNSTSLATTAYVKAQGYLTTTVAGSTYAPLASPTFTGTVSLPSLVSTSTTLGFYGATPVARPAARTMTNWSTANLRRVIDRNSWSTQDLFDFVMTLVYDHQQFGLFA